MYNTTNYKIEVDEEKDKKYSNENTGSSSKKRKKKVVDTSNKGYDRNGGGGKVDIHTHILPQDWPSIEGFDLRIVDLPKDDYIGRKAGFVKRMEWADNNNGSKPNVGEGKLFRKVKGNCIDPNIVIQECNTWGVDVQTVCTVPVLFNYHLKPTLGIYWSKFLNDSLAEQVKSNPRRMVGLGTLPLQHPEEAAKEMKRAVIEKGMRGFQIGSHINSWTSSSSGGGIDNIMLNDNRLAPIWETAKSLNVGIFIHPWDMEWCYEEYWLPWLVGMPTEVSLSMCCIMLSGIIDKIPDLKIMFAHGGGSIPGTLGRVEWGWRCRPDLVAKDSKINPREAVKKLYVDSICHDPRMLNIIVDTFGANRVALGSDYPFPLGEVPSIAPGTGEVLTAYPGQLIEESEYLNDNVKSQLLNGTAIEFLGINPSHYDIPQKC